MASEFIGAPKVTYIIDGEGLLWYWVQETQGNMVFYLPIGIILGLLVGYLAALLWSPLMGIIRNSPRTIGMHYARWEIRALRLETLTSLLSLLYLLEDPS
jgi:hypothetical protein